jgi:sec-independent protein translocase protein TatA
MGIVNPIHLIFVAVIALIVLGPKRLPELARSLGHGIREFREALSEGSSENESADEQAAPLAQPTAASRGDAGQQPPAP